MIAGITRNPASSSGHWTQHGSTILGSNESLACGFYTGSTYHIWYCYLSGGKYVVGHATASSPTGTWTKDSAHNPVMSCGAGGAWDDANIYATEVWLESGTWYMLYMGEKATGGTKIGLATASSPEGPWTKSGSNPVLAGSYDWEKSTDGTLSNIDVPQCIKVDSTYYMYYYNYILGTDRGVGVASSTNLTSWTKLYATPLFSSRRYSVGIFKHGSHYYLTMAHTHLATSAPSEILLWRSLSPEFTNPEQVRTVIPNNASISWQAREVEACYPICTSIQKTEFAENKLVMLFTGSDVSQNYSQGIIVEDDIGAALAFT